MIQFDGVRASEDVNHHRYPTIPLVDVWHISFVILEVPFFDSYAIAFFEFDADLNPERTNIIQLPNYKYRYLVKPSSKETTK